MANVGTRNRGPVATDNGGGILTAFSGETGRLVGPVALALANTRGHQSLPAIAGASLPSRQTDLPFYRLGDSLGATPQGDGSDAHTVNLQTLVNEARARGGGYLWIGDYLWVIDEGCEPELVHLFGSGLASMLKASDAMPDPVNGAWFVSTPDYETWQTADAKWRFSSAAPDGLPWGFELSDIVFVGNRNINDKPAKFDEPGLPSALNGVRSYGRDSRIMRNRFANLQGTCVEIDSGTAARSGQRLPIEGEAQLVAFNRMQKAYTGLRVIGGSDYVSCFNDISAMRDYGIHCSGNALRSIGDHIFGMDGGILLDTGTGPCYFTETEVETCYQFGIKNETHSFAWFDRLRMYDCETNATNSDATFEGGIVANKATVVTNALLDNAEDYATSSAYLYAMNAAQCVLANTIVRLMDAGARGIHINADGCKIDGVWFTGQGGTSGEVCLHIDSAVDGCYVRGGVMSTGGISGEVLWINGSPTNCHFEIFASESAKVLVSTSEATFTSNGNDITIVGGSAASVITWSHSF